MNQKDASVLRKKENGNLPLGSYCRTDMASELYASAVKKDGAEKNDALHDSGMYYKEHRTGNIRWEMLCVSGDEASHRLGKSIGTYYTVHTGDIRLLSSRDYGDCVTALREALRMAIVSHLPDFRMPDPNPWGPDSRFQTAIEAPGTAAEDRPSVSPEWDQGAHLYDVPPSYYASVQSGREGESAEGRPRIAACPGDTVPDFAADPSLSAVTDIPPAPLPQNPKPFRAYSVLVVGLGNPELTPDAFGPFCVGRLHVTRHLADADDTALAPLFPSGMHRVSAFNPMVLGQTGIETLELVRGAVHAAQPDLVILLDALAALETDSLVRTVQIATTGIHPGGGVGNRRQPLVKETLGVPVITVGVPTVIHASTLVYRALEQAGILRDDGEPDEALRSVLRETLIRADAGCVTPKDIDTGVREFAHLTAGVLNELMLGCETAAEWSGRI
ncbi:MAG: GPR endopeptidase [Eubacteriales bacterium]